MINGSKISGKGWIVIGILAVLIIVIVFMAGRGAGERNAIQQNNQIKAGTTLTSTTQGRLSTTTEEKRKLEDIKRKAETGSTSVDQKNTATDWLTSLKSLFSEYGVQFMALIVSVVGVILAISGFSLSGKKKQKFLKKYFHEIDDAYGAFKMKGKRCEAELYRLQDLIEHDLKEGKIDENTFQLLEKRIERYLKEIKEQEKTNLPE